MNVERLITTKQVADRAMKMFPQLSREKLVDSMLWFDICFSADWDYLLKADDITFSTYIYLMYTTDKDFWEDILPYSDRLCSRYDSAS